MITTKIHTNYEKMPENFPLIPRLNFGLRPFMIVEVAHDYTYTISLAVAKQFKIIDRISFRKHVQPHQVSICRPVLRFEVAGNTQLLLKAKRQRDVMHVELQLQSAALVFTPENHFTILKYSGYTKKNTSE
jgi:hypothetical protein